MKLSILLEPRKLAKKAYRSITPKNRYNLIISHEKRYVYFRVGKTGTRTVLDVLHKNTPVSLHDSWVLFRPGEYKDYFKFAIVRNPWDRLVSCYEQKVVGKVLFKPCWNKDFTYFVHYVAKKNIRLADRHIRSQSALVPVGEMDFIGRFERFAEDLNKIRAELGIPLVDIPHKNKTRHKHYSSYYTSGTRDIVARLYAEDIENFGYKFGD